MQIWISVIPDLLAYEMHEDWREAGLWDRALQSHLPNGSLADLLYLAEVYWDVLIRVESVGHQTEVKEHIVP